MVNYNPEIQNLTLKNGVTVDVLRLDLLHADVSGNKWFKLKYNIEEAKKRKLKGILTFGGAHSNHIAATAAACRMSGLASMAFIRGDQDAELTPTLQFARSQGMSLQFLSREKYREQSKPGYSKILRSAYPDFWSVPEGGANEEGIRGCAEILTPSMDHHVIFCACGTGATYTGLVAGASDEQVIVGINILKGNNDLVEKVNEDLAKLGLKRKVSGNNALPGGRGHYMTDEFAFKGYATYNRELVAFKREFEAHYKIPLDHVYTVKVFYGAFQLIGEGRLPPGSRVLIIHTGGLQGNAAFEKRFVNFLNSDFQ